jgi:hypothetical protein
LVPEHGIAVTVLPGVLIFNLEAELFSFITDGEWSGGNSVNDDAKF